MCHGLYFDLLLTHWLFTKDETTGQKKVSHVCFCMVIVLPLLSSVHHTKKCPSIVLVTVLSSFHHSKKYPLLWKNLNQVLNRFLSNFPPQQHPRRGASVLHSQKQHEECSKELYIFIKKSVNIVSVHRFFGCWAPAHRQ